MYGSYTAVSTPFLTLFAPFFRRFSALSGFLAPRRRERAKDGGKWAKNGRNRGAETPEIIRIPHPCRSDLSLPRRRGALCSAWVLDSRQRCRLASEWCCRAPGRGHGRGTALGCRIRRNGSCQSPVADGRDGIHCIHRRQKRQRTAKASISTGRGTRTSGTTKLQA